MHACLHVHIFSIPVTFRIDFKVLLLVYTSINGLGPKYISDMLTEFKPLRPVGSSQLEIPRVHTKKGSLLLAIMPPAVGTSFQKRSDVLKY